MRISCTARIFSFFEFFGVGKWIIAFYVSRLLSLKNIVIGNTTTDVDMKDFWDLCFFSCEM